MNAQNNKDYLNKLEKALKEYNQLKNELSTNKLATIGMQQQTEIAQKPVIDAIKEKNNKTISNLKETESQIFQLKPLEKESLKESYNLLKTSDTISPKGSSIKFPIWKINSNSKSNVGKFIIFQDTNGVEKIWQYTSPDDAKVLTEGLSEILFNNADDISKITDNDKEVYRTMITNSGLESAFNNKAKMYKKLFNDSSQPQIEEVIGDGMKKEVIIIPEDPNELLEQLIIQFNAQAAGHKNTFNHANAIMKKLLELKLLKSKDYRDILRIIYKL